MQNCNYGRIPVRSSGSGGAWPGEREHIWIWGGAAVGVAVLGINPSIAAHPAERPEQPEHHPLHRAQGHLPLVPPARADWIVMG